MFDPTDMLGETPEPRLMLALGIHPKTGEFVYRLPPEWRTWLR